MEYPGWDHLPGANTGLFLITFTPPGEKERKILWPHRWVPFEVHQLESSAAKNLNPTILGTGQNLPVPRPGLGKICWKYSPPPLFLYIFSKKICAPFLYLDAGEIEVVTTNANIRNWSQGGAPWWWRHRWKWRTGVGKVLENCNVCGQKFVICQ